jgi:hypothetical protein|tara:strand:+ start:732 stop:1067 length:336 start_codon:yes stop_codon:yes gene_type:complete
MASFGENAVHAWARIDQTGTQSIVDSYNITSITDNGVGRTIFTFSTNAINNDFVFVGMAGNENSTTTSGRTQNNDGAATTSGFRIRNFSVSGSADTTRDDNLVNVIVLSDN